MAADVVEAEYGFKNKNTACLSKIDAICFHGVNLADVNAGQKVKTDLYRIRFTCHGETTAATGLLGCTTAAA